MPALLEPLSVPSATRVKEKRVKTWLYSLLSALLLFTAAIVSNIEAVQQTLNLTLKQPYIHVFVPVELLIWIRSIAIVLLIVAHAIRHVQLGQTREKETASPQPLVLTPELLQELRLLLTQTTVSEEHQETPQLIEAATGTPPNGQEPQEHQTPDESMLPTVSEEERNKVIAAYMQGIPRREICSYLRWGSSKYSTIVKPVLDSYLEHQ